MLSKNLIDIVSKTFEVYGAKITDQAKDLLEENKKNASGVLRDSFSFEISNDQATVSLEIYAQGYLKYVENGRGPGGMPSVQDILKWISYKGIEAKGIISKPGIRRGKAAIINRNVGISNERFAFAIAKNIMRRGTHGTPVLKPVVQNIYQNLSTALLEAVTHSIENDVTDMWKEGPDINFLTYTLNP